MKIEITCIDAMCLAFLAENMSVIDPEFEAFRKRILDALKEVGFRPLNEDDILLPIKVGNNV